jgi:hypothetical protein
MGITISELYRLLSALPYEPIAVLEKFLQVVDIEDLINPEIPTGSYVAWVLPDDNEFKLALVYKISDKDYLLLTVVEDQLQPEMQAYLPKLLRVRYNLEKGKFEIFDLTQMLLAYCLTKGTSAEFFAKLPELPPREVVVFFRKLLATLV